MTSQSFNVMFTSWLINPVLLMDCFLIFQKSIVVSASTLWQGWPVWVVQMPVSGIVPPSLSWIRIHNKSKLGRIGKKDLISVLEAGGICSDDTAIINAPVTSLGG